MKLTRIKIGGDEKYAGDMYQFEDRFTDIELEKFKQAFIFFDRDGDGTMACDDVCLAMRAMGALVTEKEVKNLLKKYDPDHTGTIDVNDFIACMAEVSTKMTASRR
jgi:Ca2+-binding EF-hand superfamily protein